MVATKPIDVVREKWARKAGAAGEDYKKGIESPKKDWATETKKAESSYKAGVTAAMARGAFGKGVSAAGTNKWKDNALKKGVERYPGGIAAAEETYANKMGKVLGIIQGITLPDRGARGDARNYERVKKIGETLHEAKKRGAI